MTEKLLTEEEKIIPGFDLKLGLLKIRIRVGIEPRTSTDMGDSLEVVGDEKPMGE